MSKERVDYEQLLEGSRERCGLRLPELSVGGVGLVAHELYTRSGVGIFVYDEKGANVNQGTGFFEVMTDTILMIASPSRVAGRGAQLMTDRRDRGSVLTIDDMGRGPFGGGTVIGEPMKIDSALFYRGEGKGGFGCMMYPNDGRTGDLAELDEDHFYWSIRDGEGVALIPLLPKKGEVGSGGVLVVQTETLADAGIQGMIDRCMEGRKLSPAVPDVTFQPRLFYY